MKHLKLLYYTIPLLALLCLSSCSKESVEDTVLPYGKYPMVFSTYLEGLTATRATTHNAWTGGEKIAIQVGDEVKQYQSAKNGELSSVDSKSPFYWTNQEVYITAWYSSQYSDMKPVNFSVQADQGGNGYQISDFVYASQKITFNKGLRSNISFKHLPVKVVLNLTNGEGVTAEEVAKAKVSILNQSLVSGAINDNWTVVQIINGGTTITPNMVSNSSSSSIQQQLEVLLVPQQMKGIQFVKVTIGEGATERDYYYIPSGDDANLVAGNRYIYNITVKKSKLEVILKDNSTSWGENNDINIQGFQVTIPFVEDITNLKCSGATLIEDGIYEVNNSSTTFSFTYTNSNTNKQGGFLLCDGLCDVMRFEEADNVYRYICTDIRSDIKFNYGTYIEVGDFYNNDNTCTKEYDRDKCIGVVFKVGKDINDSYLNYDGKLSSIRGYAVALTDAVENVCEWGQRAASADTPLDNIKSADNADYNGFQNTNIIIKEYGGTNKWRYYKAFEAIINYRKNVIAPNKSSGWYLPSLKQLSDIYDLYQNAESNILYDRLKSISNDHLFRKAPWMIINTDPKVWGEGGYWTSTEKNDVDAWFIRFTDGHKEAYGKGQDWHKDSYVRAVLTF